MPGAVLGQGSSLKKENKMSALQVVANKSKEKADSGCESDSDSNYACEAPDFDEELGSACSRPSGKQNCGTGLYSGKTDAGSSRFDNVVSLDSAGRPCKKRKTESLNPVNASTVNLTASKPCSATTLPNSSLVPQESKNNSVDSDPLDVCCDVHKADGEEAAHVEDNEKVTPSCSPDSILPAVILPCAPGRKLAVVQRSPEPCPVQVPAWGPGVSEVWVVGHSYVSRLKDHFFAERYAEWARRAGFNVSLYGQEGLRLEQLRSLLEALLAGTHTPPAAVIVHLGGNDLVHLGRKGVVDAVVTELGWLAEKFPQAALAWSHIIHRSQWQGGESVKALNQSVKKINNKLDKLCQSSKLQTISHGCIRGQRYYMQDGVHLSKEGNDIFAGDLLAWLVRCTRQILGHFGGWGGR